MLCPLTAIHHQHYHYPTSEIWFLSTPGPSPLPSSQHLFSEMPRYTRSPPPIRYKYETDSGSDSCHTSSGRESQLSSPMESLRSFSSLSIRAVAGSPTPTQSAIEAGRQRVFEIASEADIDDTAYELADLIEGSSQESASILHAIQLLSDSGMNNVEYARTVALIAEELYMQLVVLDNVVADVFKSEMGLLVMDKFMETWAVSTIPL